MIIIKITIIYFLIQNVNILQGPNLQAEGTIKRFQQAFRLLKIRSD
jgi:hypothetical protein